MKITLYEAASAVRELLEQVDPETGELPEGYDNARALVASKAQAVAAFVLENDAQAAMVEAHAKTLLDRVKTARKRSEWLREYLRSHMAASGVLTIKSDDGTFTAKLDRERDESVDVFEPEQLPDAYLRKSVAAEVDDSFEILPDDRGGIDWLTVSGPREAFKFAEAPDKIAIKAAIKAQQDVPGARIVRKDRLTIK